MTGALAFGSDVFGQGNTTIRSSNFKCTGNEGSLDDCPHDKGNNSFSLGCGHHQDAGVVCIPCYPEETIQLDDGKDDHEGRLQICHDYQWVEVCVNFWTMSEAEVVCRELGLPTFGE